jgi:23S rRNA (uracil1939-C5)-methyltransferase
MAPESQIAHKQQTLIDHLTHIAKLSLPEVLDAVRGPHWAYRSKARLSVRYVEKKGRVVLGFMEKRGRFVADLERCEVLHPSVGERLPAIRDLIGSLSVARQIPQVEVAVGEHETVLVLRHLAPLTDADLLQCRAFATEQQLGLFLQPGGPDSISRYWPPDGTDLTYTLTQEGLEFAFGPADFTQVNRAINESLVARATALLEPQAEDHVLDLFCGLGNFTLPLARRTARVVGVEGDPRLIERAAANAARNAVSNVSFYAADLTKPHAVLDASYDKVLLDPPRTGAADVLMRLNCRAVTRLVYVSCNPATLARDAQILTQTQGLRLVGAGVLDMFPHTTHVESMALFVRR